MMRGMLFGIFIVSGRRILSDEKYNVSSEWIERHIDESLDNPEAFKVTNLPGLNPPLASNQFAGFITIDKKNKGDIFYWLFEASESPDTAPLLIWLNGGPGCSSMDGLFLEIGPFKVAQDGKTLILNQQSWHHAANVLFIDQPLGTGLSTVENHAYAKSNAQITSDFYLFLQLFLKRHSNYVSRDVYIFGESHSGRYIPDMSQYILKQNAKPETAIQIALQGVGIGNGWVHPEIQYDYSEYAHGIGLITYDQMKTLKEKYKQCIHKLNAKIYKNQVCLNNMDSILDSVANPNGYRLNYYDVRKFAANLNLDFPPGRAAVEKYLNIDAVREAIHAKSSQRYRECSSGVYAALAHEDGLSTLDQVSFTLEHGVRTLFYNGQWDMMCNHVATERLLYELEWRNATEFYKAKRFVWTVPNITASAGFVKEGGGLTYVVVADSGHMVPMDVPVVSLDLVKRFLAQKSFKDHRQSIDVTAILNGTALDGTQCEAQLNQVQIDDEYLLPTRSWIWVCFVGAIISMTLTAIATVWYMNSSGGARHRHQIIVEQESDVSDDDETSISSESVTINSKYGRGSGETCHA